MVPFKTRLDKLAHERAHIPSARPYKCPDCSLTFSKLPARNLHSKGHRGPKRYPCPHCASSFKDTYCLKRHVVVHTGVKQYVCEFCSRSFNQRGHLTSHLRLHTGEKPFKCQHCDERFNHNVSLKSHVMRYHEGAADSGPSEGIKEEMKEMSIGDTEDKDEGVIDRESKRKEPVTQVKKTRDRSIGRPKGRSVRGETDSVPAVPEEALDSIMAAEDSKGGHFRRASSESSWHDRGTTSAELTGKDEAEESKALRKRKVSRRPKTFDTAEVDFNSDSDFDPAEEAKKRRTSGQKSRNVGHRGKLNNRVVSK
ncbi:hypothetical protein NHX12_014460 [Muraenolepis orangiensis]|uniref:C2H2-type domain-containing protein n=1 Tax=Muraenolepis orangiensis TaxID=630683 RepID=A0A9Q0DC99_9TELE|nr:hypothetical protein NHX12_014460 [Muraenolepis orangiensis]